MGEGSLENAALEGVVDILQASGAVDDVLADTGRVSVRCCLAHKLARCARWMDGNGVLSDGEGGWGLGGVPVVGDDVLFLPTAMLAVCQEVSPSSPKYAASIRVL